MNVAVVGGGPLGLVFATHLLRVGAHVTLIRRRCETSVEHWRVSSRVTGGSFEVDVPVVSELPPSPDVVVIAVRAEQLTSDLIASVVAVRARAVVCLTPALGSQLDEIHATHPEWAMAMPAVAAEISDGVLLYWAPPTVWGAPSTSIERRGDNPALLEFVSLLRRARLPVSYTADARTRTLANTVALFPLHVAIYLVPSLRRWSHDSQLRTELARSMTAARALAARLGYVEWGLRGLAWWLSGATRVRLATWTLVRIAPRLTAFLEHHFGPKLGVQHAHLARDIDVLAQQHAAPPLLPARWREALPPVP